MHRFWKSFMWGKIYLFLNLFLKIRLTFHIIKSHIILVNKQSLKYVIIISIFIEPRDILQNDNEIIIHLRKLKNIYICLQSFTIFIIYFILFFKFVTFFSKNIYIYIFFLYCKYLLKRKIHAQSSEWIKFFLLLKMIYKK